MAPPIPGYTLMVAGQRSGKTSFLRLLLDTSDISPFATKDQLSSVAKFVQGSAGHTNHIRTASIDIDLANDPNGHPQPLSLTLIDTPSLDYKDEPTAERMVLEMLRHVDSRFAEGIEDDWKPQTGDHHVHLCIYFLDPDVIVPPSVSGPPAPPVPRARNNSFSEPEPVILEPPVTTIPLLCRPTLPPAEINTIRRLSARVNVLPVIARADTLTNDRLAAVKLAIRRDLADAGIGFGIFDMDNHYQLPKEEQPSSNNISGNANGSPAGGASPQPPANGYLVLHANGSSGGSPPPTPAAPAHLLRLPYALISPEIFSHSDGVARVPLSRHELVLQYTPSSRHPPTPKFTRGKYIRSFRWGSLDVLAPEHSDFLPLRAAIFHHMDTLRKYTREYLFEKFRDEYYRQQHSIPHHLSTSASSTPNPNSTHPNSSSGNPNTRATAHLAAMHAHNSRPILAIDTAPSHAPANRHTSLGMQGGGVTGAGGQGGGEMGRGGGGVVRAVHESVHIGKGMTGGPRSSRQRTKKITVACNFCRSRKLKCDGGRPACSQCVKRSNPCDYMPQNKRRGTLRSRKNGEESDSESEERSAEQDEHPSISALASATASASASASALASGSVPGLASAAMSGMGSVSVSPEVPHQPLSRRSSNVDRLGKDGYYGGMGGERERDHSLRGHPSASVPPHTSTPSAVNTNPNPSPAPHDHMSTSSRHTLFKDNELPHIATLSLPNDGSPSTPMSAPTLPHIRPASEQQAAQRKRAATVPGNRTRQPSSSGPKVVACNFCRARKTKCDGAHPACSSCARRSLACNYVHDSGSANGSAQKKGSGARRVSTSKGQGPPMGLMDSPGHSPPAGHSLGQVGGGVEGVYGMHDEDLAAGPGVGSMSENEKMGMEMGGRASVGAGDDGEVDLKRPSEESEEDRPLKKMRVEGGGMVVGDIP